MADKVKSWIVAIAIAIVFNMFMTYGIETFYASPQHDSFCKTSERPDGPAPEGCESISPDADTRSACREKSGYVSYEHDSRGCPVKAYCETCYADFEEAKEKYDGIVFFVVLGISLAALLAGILITKREAVSKGLLMAGVLGLILASVRYSYNLPDLFRVLLLGGVLAVLIWLGYKKVR